MSGLAPLEELMVKCQYSVSRIYIGEAIQAYNVGSNRAAVVATWLAVYFDLAAKTRSLAISGHKEAKVWIEKFDNELSEFRPEQPDTLRPLQNRERSILNDAQTKFGLISRMELTDLKRLRADRHRCAHPAYQSEDELFAPSAELVRSHIRNALEYVLIKPAIRGLLAVNRTIELMSDPGFPTSREGAVETLRSSHLRNLSYDEVSSIATQLIDEWLTLGTDEYTRRQRLAALEALRDLQGAWFAESIGAMIAKHISVESLYPTFRVLTDGRTRKWILDSLNNTSIGRIQRSIRECDLDEKNALQTVLRGLSYPAVAGVSGKRLESLRIDQLSEYRSLIPPDHWLEHSVWRVEHSSSVDTTFNVLNRFIGEPEVFGDLNPDQMKRILQAVAQRSSVNESWATPVFLETLLDSLPREKMGDISLWKCAVASLKVKEERKKALLDRIDQTAVSGPLEDSRTHLTEAK